ncbi:MAG TPA: Ig-like domain-containing protein [Kofleriaceae bacterium]|nr:Ig-like domain-containing protein [Kofleriaceae bacterium]
MRGVALVIAVLGAAGIAHADRPRPTKIDLPTLTPRDATARLVTPLEPSSRLIYVKRCGDGTCTVHFGTDDDSRTDTSSIAEGTRTIGAYRQGDAVWNEMMACVRATYAPFNIGVTDVDPGNVPHYEHLVGGDPSDLRSDLGNGVGGVSPFTCGEIPNAISYTFDVWGPSPLELCYVVAQETAHAFGLEHEMNNLDPLTYLTGPFPKRFQATDTPCGEFQNRPCDCGGSTQNSYNHIVTMFGPGIPTAPTVAIDSPASGKTVQPHFVTKVTATDDVAIDRVELYIDGTKVAEAKTQPYWLVAPDLPEGPHTVEARAFDVQGTPASATTDVLLGPPCTASKGCSGGEVCVNGGCVAGPDTPGGLGDTCQGATECLSNQCVADTEGNKFCVESCDLSPGSCPTDFICLQSGAASGVCWPSEDTGCCDSSGSGTGPALLGLGVLALVLAPRRRRRR